MRFASRMSPSQHQMPKIGLCTMEVPISNANRIRFIEESTLSRWPSSQSWSSEWHSPQGTPLSTANGFRFRGVSSKWMVFACWGSPPIQGVPFSKWMIFTSRDFPSPQRMGFASGESPSPKRMVFSSTGFPLHSEWDSLQRIPLVNSE